MTTTISNSCLSAQINHLGAELFSLKNNQNREYIWEGNSNFWGKHSPILFPIVGSLKNNTYRFHSKKYHLSRHGFARDNEFQLIHKTDSSATFSLKSSIETRINFPFDFELIIAYSLNNNILMVEYNVINNSNCQMPFAIGAHPAFALPKQFEDYALEFNEDEILNYYLLQEGLISNDTNVLHLVNRLLKMDYQLFEKDALVFKHLKSKSITLTYKSIPFLKIDFNEFPNLGLWTVNKAPFVCIEPWFGYSDTLNEYDDLSRKEGIQILEKNQIFKTHYSIEIL